MRQIILAGVIIIALLAAPGTVMAQADSHNGGADPIGPGSPLFGLKVALENLDETFTVNDTQRVEKQVAHAQERIDEAEQELSLNRSGSADRVLDLYREKLNQTEAALPRFPSSAPGLLHAQELIARQQGVIADLLSRHPGSSGLGRAYNNSQALGQKFGEKTKTRFERVAEKNNTSSFRPVKLENGKQDNASAGNSGKDKDELPNQVKDKKDEGAVALTSHPTPADDRGSPKGSGKKET